MCGIVGAVAQRNIVPTLVEGLRRSNTVATTRAESPSTRWRTEALRSVARVAELNPG